MAGKTRPVFGYWDIRGYGQPIHNLLKYLKIEFDETVYPCTVEIQSGEWEKAKDKLGLDFPNLPYWIDGDIKLSESRAIIKHLARVNDPSLLPENDASWRRADMLDGVATDIWRSLGNACYINSKETIVTYDKLVPEKLELVSKFIGSDEWCLGNKISYLDFLLYEILYHTLVFRPNILDKYPALKGLMTRFEQLPAIAEFIKSPNYIKGPCFRPWAKFPI